MEEQPTAIEQTMENRLENILALWRDSLLLSNRLWRIISNTSLFYSGLRDLHPKIPKRGSLQ